VATREAPLSPRAVEKLTIALPAASGVFAPHHLAQQRGFFREEGLAVELPIMRSNLIASGMASGEVPYSGSFGPSVRNALTGLPVRVLAATVDKSTRQVMAMPGVQSMDQLRGQAVAVNVVGDALHNSGALAFDALGIDSRDVTWLAVGGVGERFLAVQQGAAQATIFSGAEVRKAESLGFMTLLHLNDVAPIPEAGIATGLVQLERGRDQPTRVLRAIVRALRVIKTDRAGSLAVFMQALGIPRDEAEQAYDAIVAAYSADGTLSERSLRFTIEAEKKQMERTDEIAFSQVADFGPLYEVLAELGITPAAGSAR
jgi:NitT/TauT family transport system substrate-binding protein